jgi:glycosyltransferase involved in cell wall biosynthesis
VIADSERIRLLKFIPVFAIGGTERQIMNLISRLDPGRFDLHFGCSKRVGEFLPEIEARRIPVTEHNIKRAIAPETFRQQMRFARYLRWNRIDIVHSYNFYANYFAIPAAWLARTPVIVASIRDTGAFMTPLQRLAQRTICRLADVVLVNADAIRQWLISEGFRPDKLVVIRNGIDIARFGRPGAGAGVRRELGMTGDAPLIAMLARINRLKGVEYFFEAAAAIAADFPDARFLVVGDALVMKDGAIAPKSDYRMELEGHIRRLGLEGRVLFTGFRLDVPDLLSEVTVSVLPSLSEGLSNTILESMAAAVPVVATRIGGTPEAVDDGVSGLLVPPRDSAALARAIRRILEDRELAARLGQAARRRVVDHFSMERMVGETERLYVSLLAQAQRRTAHGVSPDPGVVRIPADVSPRR